MSGSSGGTPGPGDQANILALGIDTGPLKKAEAEVANALKAVEGSAQGAASAFDKFEQATKDAAQAAQQGAAGAKALDAALDGVAQEAAQAMAAVKGAESATEALTQEQREGAAAAKAQAAELAAMRAEMARARAEMAAMGATIQQQNQALAALQAQNRRTQDDTDRHRRSVQDLGGAYGLTSAQIQQLIPQLNDIFTQLSMGSGVLMTATAQGPQIVQQLGGITATFRALGSVAAWALGGAQAGMIGLTAVVAASVIAAESADRAMAGLSARLRVTRADFADLAADVVRVSRALAETTGASTSDARKAAEAIAGSRGFAGSASELERLTRVSVDLARALGVTVPEAGQRLAQALKSPGEAARRLASEDFASMTDALRRQIEVLEAAGQKTEASKLVVDAYARAAAGAASELTPLQRALQEVSQAATGLWNALRPALEAIGRPILEGIAEGFNLLAAAIRGVRESAEAAGGVLAALPNPFDAANRLGANVGRALGTDRLGAAVGGGMAPPQTGALTRESSAAEILTAVRAEAVRQGVDPDFAVRVARQESGGRQFGSDGTILRSRAGAMGVMQLMPGTARDLGVDPEDTAANIRGGILYLARQLGAFGGDQSLAAAAYNAGPQRVNDYLAGRGTFRAETWNYVNAVARGGGGRDGGLLSGAAAAVARADDSIRGRDQVSDQRALAVARAGVLERALEVPNLDPETATRYREALEKVRAEIVALEEPMTRLQAQGERQARLYRLQEGAARALAEAEMQAAEAARQRGAGPSEQAAAGLEGRRQAQDRLTAALVQSIERTERSTDVLRSQTEAVSGGARAMREAAIRTQAQADALAFAEAGTEAYAGAVEMLVQARMDQRAAEVDLQTANLVAQQRDQISLLEQEGRLIGMNVDAREQELAVLRERQRILSAGGDVSSAASQAAMQSARRLAEVRQENRLLENSWNELSRIGEQAFDRIGGAITQAFANGSLKALDFGNIARATFAEVIQAGLRMGVLNPVLNGVFGGQRPTLWGAAQAAGGFEGVGLNSATSAAGALNAATAGVPGSGSGMSSNLGFAAGGASLYRNLTGGIANSPWFNGGVPFNTGFSWADAALNYQLIPGTMTEATSTALAGLGNNIYGPATASQVAAAGGYPGLTVGSALGSGASILGGAYGLYSGIQKGGVGGAVQGIGGVASMAGGAGMLAGAMGVMPGLAALGRAGIIAGAIASIAGMFLPGAKPSSSAAAANIRTDTGEVRYDSNTKNFSQANQDEAEKFARGIADLETKMEKLLGFGIGTEVGVGVDSARRGDPANIFLRVGGQYGEFSRDEGGAEQMAKQAAAWLLEEFKKAADASPDENMRKVVRNTGRVEDLEANVAWYENTYKAMLDLERETNQFKSQVEALTKPFDDAINKARELGLETERLTERREEERAKLYEARERQITQIDLALEQRRGRATDPEQIISLREAEAVRSAKEEFEAMRETLRNLDMTTEEAQRRLDALADAQAREAAERERLYQQERNQRKAILALMQQASVLDVSGFMQSTVGPVQSVLDAFREEAPELAALGIEPWKLYFGQLRAVMENFTEEQIDAVIAAFPEVEGQEDDAIRMIAEERRQANRQSLREQYNAQMNEAHGNGFVNQVTALIRQFEQMAPQYQRVGLDPWALLGTQLEGMFKQMTAEQLRVIQGAFAEGTFGAGRIEDDLIRQIAANVARTAEATEEANRLNAAGQNIRQWLDAQRVTPGAGVSPQAALTEAQSQFGRDLALARGNDADALARITGTAQNLLTAGEAMFASSPQFQALRQMVLSSLESLPATRSYDALMLEELRKLGGSVEVTVSVEAIRVITEALNALPQGERDRLVQAATIVRTIQEQMGRLLSPTELAALMRGGAVVRTIEEALGRLLTEAEAERLADAGAVRRTVEEALGRVLTPSEVAQMVREGRVQQDVEQRLGRALTAAEAGSLVQAGSVLRSIEQGIGRQLTDAERASIIEKEWVVRLIAQGIGRPLTVEERNSLVQGEAVVRAIEQRIGRNLTPEERASLVQGGFVVRDVREILASTLSAAELARLTPGADVILRVQEVLGRTLTPTEAAALTEGGLVTRTVQEALGRTLTTAESDLLTDAGAVLRKVEESLGRTLTAAEASALVTGGQVTRLIAQHVTRDLTQNERNMLVSAGSVVRQIEQSIGRQLTDAERASIVQTQWVERLIAQGIGRPLTAAERASLLETGQVLRLVEQRIGRALSPEERASILTDANVLRQVRQQIETTETVEISRSIDEKLSGLLSLVYSGIVHTHTPLAHIAAAAQALVNVGIHRQGPGGLYVTSSVWSHANSNNIVKFAEGGPVMGGIPGMDSVPALLMPGEYVLRQSAASRLGRAALDAMNDGMVPAVPIPVAGDGGMLAELRALRAEVSSLRREVTTLRAERATDARAQRAETARGADAAEETAGAMRQVARGAQTPAGRRGRAA